MLNVSHTTVSRSLNDSPLISKETKKRVKELARQYNYIPNVSARSLVLSKSYNIGLFFSTFKTGTTASFFLDSVRAANAVIKDRYTLSVEAIDDFRSYESVNRKRFDGILLMSQNPQDESFIAHVLKQEIPFVVLNREIQGQKVTSVLTDDYKGAVEAVEYLIRCGHRRIGMIQGKKEFRSSLKRKQGYLDVLKAHGIDPNPLHMKPGNFDLESGYLAMSELLQLSDCPTAVFCANDDMAIGAMKAIHESRLRVPQDVSLIGYDDNGISSYLSPALTTVKRPIEQVTRDGTRLLLEVIEGREQEVGGIKTLPTELIVRESVQQVDVPS
jgi:LacI family transcriptional regulator